MTDSSIISVTDTTSERENLWAKAFEGHYAVAFPAVPRNLKPRRKVTSATVHLSSSKGDTLESTRVLLVATWALMLCQYLDVSDVAFGSTNSHSQVNVVPQRIRVCESTTLEAYLRLVEEQTRVTEQLIPLSEEDIAKLSSDARQAFEAIQNVLVFNEETSNTAVADPESLKKTTGPLAPYPLLLYSGFNHETCSTSLSAIFDDRALAPIQAERIIAQVQHVWHQLLASSSSNVRVRDIRLLNQRDQRDILLWNQSIPEYIDGCVHHLISQRMLKQPDMEAVCAWDGSLTYRQLDQLSARLACYLRDAMISCEDCVPLLFEKSKWHVVAMLGVLRAGAAFVPLDPANPRERLQDIVSQLHPKLLLTSPGAIARTGRLSHVEHVLLSTGAERWLPVEGFICPTVKATNSMYVVFTSGSTGRPKGVVIEHGMFCSKANPRCEVLERSETTRILQFASFSFDLSIEDILLTIMYGGCVCIPSEEDRVNDLEGVMQRMQVTCAHLTPSVANTLYPENIPLLRQLRLGGEAMTTQHVRRWARMLDLKNAYGPTECTVTAAVSKSLSLDADPADLGRAVACRSWIVHADDHHQLCAIGCIGELLLEGPILARGYYKEPVKTAESFIFDPAWCLQAPFFEQKYASRRFYKTGDLVMYMPDGRLKYIGRKDSQGKLRGQRLELGEIESHLRNCNLEVDDLAVEVIRLSDDPADACLVTFFALGDHFAKGDETALGITAAVRNKLSQMATHAKSRLSASLPLYAVPSIFLPMKNLPRTISGKTDRKALRFFACSLGSHGLSAFS